MQREALLAEIRREPNPEEVASLHSAGLSETALKFVKQQSSFVHKVQKTFVDLVIFLQNLIVLRGRNEY